MNTRRFLAAVSAICLLAASAWAHEEAACCATGSTKSATCEASFAQLDLTATQKAKMKKLAAECDQAGCTKDSLAKMEKGARKVLSKEQFAAWKSACSAHSEKS